VAAKKKIFFNLSFLLFLPLRHYFSDVKCQTKFAEAKAFFFWCSVHNLHFKPPESLSNLADISHNEALSQVVVVKLVVRTWSILAKISQIEALSLVVVVMVVVGT
jgi:hypothetical protein